MNGWLLVWFGLVESPWFGMNRFVHGSPLEVDKDRKREKGCCGDAMIRLDGYLAGRCQEELWLVVVAGSIPGSGR